MANNSPDSTRFKVMYERDAARAECEDLRHDIERHVRIAADLATECEKLRKDAERYRWLRETMFWRVDAYCTDGNDTGHWQTKLFRKKFAGSLDAAIDAARGEGK